VIGSRLHVVFDQRRRPQLGEAQAFDVVEVVDHALDVAAVAAMAQLAVELVGQAGHAVILRVAVGEAVRHDLVDRVLGVEALALGRARFARQQLVGISRGAAVLAAQHDVETAGLDVGIQRQVDEQVILAGHPADRGDAHARIVDRRLEFADRRTVDHQLQALVLHAGPPERRIHVVDGGGLGVNGAGGQEEGADQAPQESFVHDVSRDGSSATT
jgi:hypothetical protein